MYSAVFSLNPVTKPRQRAGASKARKLLEMLEQSDDQSTEDAGANPIDAFASTLPDLPQPVEPAGREHPDE